MRNLRVFFLSLLIVTSLSSNCQDAIPIKQGETAKFTGILITSELSDDLRKAVIQRDSFQAQNESLNTIIKLQDDNFLHQQKKVTILLEQNDKLALRLGEERSVGKWEKITYFALGVAAVLAGTYVVKATKTSN